jgi:hypothetical protein
MQNKPNLLNTQMSVSSALAKTYENNLCSRLLENKPNTKPIKANTNPKQTQNKPNTNPIQTQTNPISKGIPYCSAEPAP